MARPRDEKTETEVESVLRLMQKYKSITYAQHRSKALLQEAAGRFSRNFAHLPDERAKQLFLSLIHFSLNVNINEKGEINLMNDISSGKLRGITKLADTNGRFK